MYCVLIVFYPQLSHAIYLDSGSEKKKDYSGIKAVLDKALTSFAAKAGPLKEEKKRRGILGCTHTTEFACVKQSTPDNGMDAWYAILHMMEFVGYSHDLLLPSGLRNRTKSMADLKDEELRGHFRRVQRRIATIVQRDVVRKGGLFFYDSKPLSNYEVESRLVASCDERPFNSLEGVRPFPPRPSC